MHACALARNPRNEPGGSTVHAARVGARFQHGQASVGVGVLLGLVCLLHVACARKIGSIQKPLQATGTLKQIVNVGSGYNKFGLHHSNDQLNVYLFNSS